MLILRAFGKVCALNRTVRQTGDFTMRSRVFIIVPLLAITASWIVTGCSTQDTATNGAPSAPRQAANSGNSETAALAKPGEHGGTGEAKYSPQSDPEYPFKLVSMLESESTFGGMRCWLKKEGAGWHKSKFDGVWNAVLRRTFGPNEVSCLLESADVATVQRIELEAEFYEPGVMENEMMLQFCQSAQVLMHPAVPTEDFVNAVLKQRPWSDGAWALAKHPHSNAGFDLRLTKIKN